MSSKKIISVIIPTYNRAKNLEKLLLRLKDQIDHQFEIIVVDDGSTDNTFDTVKKFNNLKYFKIDNHERAYARNYGAKKSKGKYLNFIDSDDLVYNNHIAVANNVIKNLKYQVFHLSYDFINLEKNIIKNYIITKNINKKLVYGNILSCNSIFIKKDVFDKFKFNENKKLSGSEDWELWLRISNNHKIYGIKDVTSSIINHSKRSMIIMPYRKIKIRLFILINLINKNLSFNQNQKNKIFSECLSLLSLYASIHNNKYESIKLSLIALYFSPLSLFRKRLLVIIKNIIFK